MTGTERDELGRSPGDGEHWSGGGGGILARYPKSDSGIDPAGILNQVFLLANHLDGVAPLKDAASQAGLTCCVGQDLPDLSATNGSEGGTDAVIVDLDSVSHGSVREIIDKCKNANMPVLTLVPYGRLGDFDPSLNPDEVLVCPFGADELAARVQQAIYRVNGSTGGKLLRSGELTIDLERYDVTVSGRRVSLTYKEFQLLTLLASNPGRVYSRDALLSQVWGYDYLGGTRTVDVHVRRLRSKVEGPGRSFVETVRNVGYRFKNSS